MRCPNCSRTNRWWLFAAESIKCPRTSLLDHLPGAACFDATVSLIDRRRSAVFIADKRSLATDSTGVLPSKDETIARQEIQNRACRNGCQIGEEIMQMQPRDEQPHQREISDNRNETVRQMKSDEPSQYS